MGLALLRFFLGGLDKGSEKLGLYLIFGEAFRVPLHADEKALRIGRLGSLDDPFGTARDDPKPFAKILYGLVVEGVYLERGVAENACEARVGLEGDGMDGVAVVDTEAAGDVLHERTAAADIDPLASEADPEKGFFAFFDPRVAQGLLESEAGIAEDPDCLMSFFAVFGGGNVRASGEEEAIEPVQVVGNVLCAAIGVWEDNGDSTGVTDGADVVLCDEAGDADEGAKILSLRERLIVAILSKLETEESGSCDESRGEEGATRGLFHSRNRFLLKR